MSEENKFDILQKKIELAKANGEPIDDYIKEQIQVLKKAHDEFVKLAVAKGYSDNEVSVVEIEIEQFAIMKHLAESIGLPTEEYDNLIKDARIRLFGEENWKNFFGDNS